MKLIAYEIDRRKELGVLNADGGVSSLRQAMERLLSRKAGVDVFWPWIETALNDSRVLLASLPALEPLIDEAITAYGKESEVADSVDGVLQLPFVTAPNKIYGLGHNYRELCKVEGIEPLTTPHIFVKLPASITAPWEDIRLSPKIKQLDFEAELAVVIGKVGRDIPVESAHEYIAGYTIINDFCAKILPRPATEAETTTVVLKGGDQYAPLGSILLTGSDADSVIDKKLICRVNGEERQSFPVNDWVHDPAQTVSYLSGIGTLYPGDVIAMGTSVGIGIIEIPPRLLKDGDVVECEIEGIPGTRNTIRMTDVAGKA